MIKLIQHVAVTTGVTDPVSINLAQATLAGSLIIVMKIAGSSRTVVGITDNAPMGSGLYIKIAQVTRGTEIVEMWYCANSNAGATTITLDLSAAVACPLFVFEVQNMNTSSPLMQFGTISDAAATADPLGASVTTTDPLCFLAGVITVGSTVTSVDAPWTIGDITSGDASAYLITTYRGAGTYQPQFHQIGSATSASITAAFREAPHSIDIRETQIGLIKPSIIKPEYYEG